MVIDTSALLAILQNQPERRAFDEAIEAAATRALSAASVVEASVVMEIRHGAEGVRDLDELLEKAQIEIVEVSLEQARDARRAARLRELRPRT